MTGLIFTCSLLCTAVFQADPSVVQRCEQGIVRQMLEAVIPVPSACVPATPVRPYGSDRSATACETAFRPPVQSDIRPIALGEIYPTAPFVKMHPIRGPSR